jgi:hypothetical protein
VALLLAEQYFARRHWKTLWAARTWYYIVFRLRRMNSSTRADMPVSLDQPLDTQCSTLSKNKLLRFISCFSISSILL